MAPCWDGLKLKSLLIFNHAADCGFNAAQQIHIGIQNDFTPATKAHPAILVRNFNALRKHVEALNIHPIDDQPLPGAERFYLHDPFGNRIGFLEWI